MTIDAPPPAPVPDPSEIVAPPPAADPRERPYLRAAPPAPRSKRLGLVALVLAIVVFVLSVSASILIGVIASPYATVTGSSFNFTANFNDPNPVVAALGVAMTVHVMIGTLIGGWAIVQGIVAVSTKRGRAFGVWAIVLATVAPILSLILFSVMLIVASPH
jgi:hypothetical protein